MAYINQYMVTVPSTFTLVLGLFLKTKSKLSIFSPDLGENRMLKDGAPWAFEGEFLVKEMSAFVKQTWWLKSKTHLKPISFGPSFAKLLMVKKSG